MHSINKELSAVMIALLSGQTLDVRRELILEKVLRDPLVVRYKHDRLNMSRPCRMHMALQVCKRIVQLKCQLLLNKDEVAYLLYLIDDLLPISLHLTLVTDFIQDQASEQQAKALVPHLERFEYIGCYAQTELGHGSDVSGILTTATYVKERDQFDIHSPSLEATKMWAGGSGILATHAILMARLIVDGKDYGVHAFFIRIRDAESHRAMPGILIADLGSKMGVNSADNGAITFNHYRVGRDCLLMKHCQLDRNGFYTPPKDPKALYSGMTLLRTYFLNYSALALSRAVTIAVRYAHVRKQFKDINSVEVPLIQHQSIQYRLIPALALTYAIAFASFTLNVRMKQLQLGGSKDSLKAYHIQCCTLKVLSTAESANSIEVCRMACGGNGYLNCSGFAENYNSFVHMLTAEGENHVLSLQVGNSASKSVAQVVSGSKIDNADFEFLRKHYKNEFVVTSIDDAQSIVAVFEHRAALMAFKLYDLVQQMVASGLSQIEAIGRLQSDMYKFTFALGQYRLVESFKTALDGPLPKLPSFKYGKQSAFNLMKKPLSQLNSNVASALNVLFKCYAFYLINENTMDFVECGSLNATKLKQVRTQLLYQKESLLQSVVPYLPMLVDSLAVPDFVVNSAIGHSDGKVYERVWDSIVFSGANTQNSLLNPPNLQKHAKSLTDVVPDGNLNKIFNREIYENLNALQISASTAAQQSRAPGRIMRNIEARSDGKVAMSSMYSELGDGQDHDQETETEKQSAENVRQWIETHALVIKPLVSGSVFAEAQGDSGIKPKSNL
ncbi:hypothetical protein MP228_005071 [Amoeboaphelidium protococcarum]|nr:hypothetical protein MP228_005071 [Amoeboaphelidium protococcarum]